ncbi:GNAT family N-acetyltransferase [Kocuria sp. KSNUG]|uniref:GNAT family N-acetyltransferase n=1 Tax=Kocuria TaxID=57493 RepID=UPI00075036C0|nr:GNAT family N-acetyltransferase [Kocuria rhizophila]KUP27077.1 acetyltransferase [Kocuria rhizophila]RLP59758.1 GNAT family N-acetyltransferase [Kocuria rhizophila]
MALTLRHLTSEDEPVVRALHEQLRRDDFDFLLERGSWDEVLEATARQSRGTNLPPGRVRADYLLAEVDGQVVGRTSIRYDLTEHLLRVGGHVGYGVGPAFRRRGYATEILRQSVGRLNAAGVERVLVTCADDNAASAATIEACGGVLENVVPDGDGRPTRRYWIG